MSKSLVLTLGHNSSAIVVKNGQVLGGYEEERFSKIKSDSAFPMKSILRLIEQYGDRYDDICIGHWFTGGMISANKYIDTNVIESLTDTVHSIQVGMTHHDSHLLSAKVFADHYSFPKNYMAIVADGFGTFGECITLYDCNVFGHTIINRFFGYGKSLGMLYQYATAYLDMKMHNHEYKMLGYEAHITDVLSPESIQTLGEIILTDSSVWVKDFYRETIDRDTDPVVNKAALAAAQHEIANRLDSVLERLEFTSCSLYEKRVMIAYYVQGIVEAVMLALVNLHKPKNLLVAGGLFYNVKLNSLLADNVQQLCVMPLAGDQGAGLGVYHGVHGDLKWPGHLAWGHRRLNDISGPGIITANEEDAFQIVAEEILKNKMVNIVRGAMEFGPRSLCNTATLAIPDMSVVETINTMNDRTTVMPMAPAMSRNQVSSMLVDTDKVVGSLEYMIVTRNVKPAYVDQMKGASHEYKLHGHSTCRPQALKDSDHFMNDLVESFGPLINTSFNYHGVPIAFDKETIEYSHVMQNLKSAITTVVITEE